MAHPDKLETHLTSPIVLVNDVAASAIWQGIIVLNVTPSTFQKCKVFRRDGREEINKLRLFLEEVQGEESNYGYGRRVSNS